MGKKSKSATLVFELGKEFATTPIETATKSTAAPSKAKGVATNSSRRRSRKKSVALHPSKDQRKAGTSSSSPDEEQLFAALTRSPSKKKKSVVPPPSGAATRTRSKSGFKVSSFSFLFIYCFYFVVLCCVFLFFCPRQVTHKPSRFGDAMIVVEVIFTHSFCFAFSLGQIHTI